MINPFEEEKNSKDVHCITVENGGTLLDILNGE
jgi:hypothetical protein